MKSISLNLTLRQLEYALSVRKHGSFSLAAQECHVSQPSLSEAIQKLESELGAMLFDRSKSPLKITEFGQGVLEKAASILHQCHELLEMSESWNKHIRGTLRVGIIPTLAPSLIPFFLKSFRKKYPEVKIEIKEQSTQVLLKSLESADIDVGILSTPSSAPGHLNEKPLFYEGFLVYAAQGSELLKEEMIKFPDLEDKNLILMDESHCVRDQILSICERKTNPSLKTTVHGGIQTLLSVVEQENGFTLIPELMAEFINKKQLRPIRSSQFRRKISLLTNKNHLKKNLIHLLGEEIMTHLPSHIPRRITQKIQLVDPQSERFD